MIEIKQILFSQVKEAGISLKDKNPNYSLRKHAEEKGADIAINAGMFSNGDPKTDPYYYWNIVDMLIDGQKCGGGNYTDKGIAIGRPWEGISAYPSTTSNSLNKPVDFIGGAPTLIIDGKISMDMKGLQSSFATGYTNRTALGIDANSFYIATTRGEHYTLRQVAQAMVDRGCKFAIDFDGGGSTAYYEKRDDGTLDYYTQGRNVTSAFYICLKKETQPVTTPTTKKKVFIGVGHGGSDPGASYNGINEKDVNLTVALSCYNDLTRHGVEVLLSRNADENDTLSDEIAECNKFSPDCAIDIHHNAGKGDGAEFFRSVVGTGSKRLAELLEAEIIKFGQNSRGVKTKVNSSGNDYYGFLREIWCVSVIAEASFIDNLVDFSIMDTDYKQKLVGTAYAKGILAYLGIEWVDEVRVCPTCGRAW